MRCVFIQESRSCESLDQVRLLNVSLQLKHSFIHRLWPLYCMCAAHGQTTTHKTYLAGRSGHKMINQPTESEQPHTLHLHLGSSQILKKSFPLSLYWVQLSPQFVTNYLHVHIWSLTLTVVKCEASRLRTRHDDLTLQLEMHYVVTLWESAVSSL